MENDAAAAGTQVRLPRAWPETLLHTGLLVVAAGLLVASLLQVGAAPPSLVAAACLLVAALVVVRIGVLLRRNRSLVAGFTASDEFKTQLLRFISHEIANPLSPLKLQADLLRNGAPDAARSWKVVDRSIARLESLSRDVRLMALAETRRIVQATAVADLVPRIAAAVQAQQAGAAQRGVALRSELPGAPLAAPIDAERFDQVVDNLLSNALKFTPQGGTIQVRLFRAPTGWAVLDVKDSGSGMDAGQQARLFSAFGRPQGSSAPGLGLGLYLCKAIVDGHGGRIGATSDGPGQGSRFRVELPPAQAALVASATAPRAYTPATHGGQVPDTRPPDLPV
jgi:signal transduction histidine kinase